LRGVRAVTSKVYDACGHQVPASRRATLIEIDGSEGEGGRPIVRRASALVIPPSDSLHRQNELFDSSVDSLLRTTFFPATVNQYLAQAMPIGNAKEK
jgi:hypothetical protein